MSIRPSAEPAAVDPDLFRGIDLLCLDAGNTVVFLDHARLSRICRVAGFETTTDALIHAEGEAKHAQERGALLEFEWSEFAAPSARAWGAFVATMMVSAGVPRVGVRAGVEAAWIEHGRRNLWSLVPEGLVSALDQARAAGVRIAIVSNSEGKLVTLLNDVGVLGSVDVVVDSGVVGVQKPDPRISDRARRRQHSRFAGSAPRRRLRHRRRGRTYPRGCAPLWSTRSGTSQDATSTCRAYREPPPSFARWRLPEGDAGVDRAELVAIIPGDGIGPEVTAQATRVLDFYVAERGLPIALWPIDLGADRYLRDGVALSPDVRDRIIARSQRGSPWGARRPSCPRVTSTPATSFSGCGSDSTSMPTFDPSEL